MTVRELSDDQLTELKQRMIDDEIYEKEGRGASYGELAEAESVPDEKVFEKYDGVNFSNDDFSCTTEPDTGYAAVWFDYNGYLDVNKVFRERGKCLDYLVSAVFRRAKNLNVDVVNQYTEPVFDVSGTPVFPKMTREQVRDHLGSGMDFGLVLSTSLLDGSPIVDEQVSVGIREVEIDSE